MIYTITEIAKMINIPESSARNYRDKYSQFFNPIKDGKLKKYNEEAIEALKIIRECSNNNMSELETYDILLKKLGPAVEITEYQFPKNEDITDIAMSQQHRNGMSQDFPMEIFEIMAQGFTKKEPLSVNLKEAAKMLGISINAMKELSQREDFPIIRINNKNILIPVEALKLWLLEESKRGKRD